MINYNLQFKPKQNIKFQLDLSGMLHKMLVEDNWLRSFTQEDSKMNIRLESYFTSLAVALIMKEEHQVLCLTKFIYGKHLGWQTKMQDIILLEHHLRAIPPMFGNN